MQLTIPPFTMVTNNYILYSDNVKYVGVNYDSSLSFHLKSSSFRKLFSSLFQFNPELHLCMCIYNS